MQSAVSSRQFYGRFDVCFNLVAGVTGVTSLAILSLLRRQSGSLELVAVTFTWRDQLGCITVTC